MLRGQESIRVPAQVRRDETLNWEAIGTLPRPENGWARPVRQPMWRRSFTTVLIVFSVICAAHVARAEDTNYTGFWKVNCQDAFGLQIKPVQDKLYSVSFCGPGGCFEPGTYRRNTTIDNDPDYEVVSPTKIKVKGQDGSFTAYVKCTNDTDPLLDYDSPAVETARVDHAVKPLTDADEANNHEDNTTSRT